ncbi:hypothetical protein C8Q80DRAFT_1210820 [Daedaleopsis nitida]|nr:hypothetical protein C8Q80DRAFT_1210820 [Daedaleopsis nitida]
MDTNNNGRPTTTYTIDGELVGTYTAPFTALGATQYNVTFFSKRDLSPGSHHLVITHQLDSSRPATFWLDYFLTDSSPPPMVPLPHETTTTSTSPHDAVPINTLTTLPFRDGGTTTAQDALANHDSTTTSTSSLATAIPPSSITYGSLLLGSTSTAILIGTTTRAESPVKIRRGQTLPTDFRNTMFAFLWAASLVDVPYSHLW